MNFPQIETSKCERIPVWGRHVAPARRSAYLQRREHAVFNVPAPCVRSVLMFQRRSRARTDGRDGLSGLMETQREGKRPGSDYVRLLHLPSEFCYISRQRRKEGGSREKDGDFVSGRLSASQIVMETC